MEITPILSSLNIQAAKIRKQELEKTMHMLDLDKSDAKKVEKLTQSITDKLLFDVIQNLKIAAKNEDQTTIDVAKKLLINDN